MVGKQSIVVKLLIAIVERSVVDIVAIKLEVRPRG
jgi:hypothetical protein